MLFSIAMLSVDMLNVIMLNVVPLHLVSLNVIMLSVVTPKIIMLSVAASLEKPVSSTLNGLSRKNNGNKTGTHETLKFLLF